MKPSATQLLLVIGLASVLFLSALGAIGLTDRDEGRNAEAGREMVESGDWITPMFNYEPRFIKPALLYWLMSGSYVLWGVNEFAARFPSALCGIGLIALQYLFLARVGGQRLALLGALMLLLNIEVIGLGRQALTDMVLMFFTTLAVYAFWVGFHATEHRRRWFVVAYAAMACATLDKGPVGFLLPLLAIVPYIAVTRQWRRLWQDGFVLGGLAVFLALAVPWYATMISLHGTTYTSAAREHTLWRYLNPFYGWGGTIFFYVPVLLFGFWPWSAFLPPALYRTYKAWKEQRLTATASNRYQAGDVELLGAVWCVAVFVFFSLGATRLPHYIGPLYPAAAIVTAHYWARAEEAGRIIGLRGAIYTMTVIGVVLGLILAALPVVFAALAPRFVTSFPQAEQFQFGPGPMMTAAVLILGAGYAAYCGLTRAKLAGVFETAGATLALVVLITFHLTLPHVARSFVSPPQELAEIAGALLQPADHLIFYGPARPSVVFYAKRKVVVVRRNEEANIDRYVDDSNRTMIVLPSGLRDRLPPVTSTFQVVQERSGWMLIAEGT